MTDSKREVWVRLDSENGAPVGVGRTEEEANCADMPNCEYCRVVRYVPAHSVPEAPEPVKLGWDVDTLLTTPEPAKADLVGRLHRLADSWTEIACVRRSESEARHETYAAEVREELADELRAELEAKSEPEKASGWVPKLVELCDWLAKWPEYAGAATHILCNYNDPDNPGDGSCRALHECLPAPPDADGK